MAKLLTSVLLGLVLAATSAARAETLTVFAASSLSDVLSEIGQDFAKETSVTVRFSFAASSTIARQVEAGAPADVVALASEDWAEYLAKRGLIGETIRPAGNRLVLVAPAGTSVPAPLTPGGFAAALGEDGRIALGDPAHVPAGIYAQAALRRLGLWHLAAPRIAGADNVRAALALVARGEAALAVVYATDAAIADVTVLAILPESSHPAITYPFATVSDRTASEQFLTFVKSRGATFSRHGFTVR